MARFPDTRGSLVAALQSGDEETRAGEPLRASCSTCRTVDAVFTKATSAPADMFWGDRFGKPKDPSGHEWGVATHVEEAPPEEVQKRMAAMGAAAGG